MDPLEPSFGDAPVGAADLGHQPRNRGLVKIAAWVHRRPGGALPKKLHSPKDDTATGRLMSRKEVTHPAVLQAHCRRPLDLRWKAGGPVLVSHGTTELDSSGLRPIADLGSIGGDLGRGCLGHNSPAYDPQHRAVLGLAGQIRHGRTEGVAKKRERKGRESRRRIDGRSAGGPAPAGRPWAPVSDRGSDTFEHPARPRVAGGRAGVARLRGVTAVARRQSGGGRRAGRRGGPGGRGGTCLRRGDGTAAARPARGVREATAGAAGGGRPGTQPARRARTTVRASADQQSGENGRWRPAAPDVDASGKLPTGETFTGPAELKKLPLTRKGVFLENLTSKMLSYAAGRELTASDEFLVKSITADLEENDYKFSRLVLVIAQSVPMTHRRNLGPNDEVK